MTNAIVKQAQISTIDDLGRVAKMLAISNYFDAKGNGEVAVAQIATKIMAGQEMGYGPFASVQGIHVIQGRPTLSANLMAAAVKAHPKYDYRVREMSDRKVVIEFFESAESLGLSSFTIEEATKAGTKNLDKFPRNMLFARAMSNGVRWYCPDVFNGNAVYTPEEFDITVDATNGSIANETTASKPIDTETGEIIAALPQNTVIVQELVEIPDKVAQWLNETNPAGAAKAWAVECGAQPNEHAARNSMEKIVKDNGGKLTKANLPPILTAYFFRQQEHLAEAVDVFPVETVTPEAA